LTWKILLYNRYYSIYTKNKIDMRDVLEL